ncbi:MAG: Nif3-like dinuclear metal center hexameric protein [Halobaculum sp.]
MELAEMAARLDERLRTAAYSDVDASANGVQIGPTRSGREIERVAFAVDAAQATARAAAERGADALVAHHGVVWGGLDRVTGATYDRVTAFTDRDLALYVSHLPLDGHPELGNAARLGDGVGLVETDAFGTSGGEPLGRFGRFPESVAVETAVDRVTAALPAGDHPVRSFAFGPDEVRSVAILTGSGADWVEEAADRGADLFVTGEGKQQLYHAAREAGVNVVLGGHYRTEVGGVRALAEVVAEWGLETEWIDHPTGL